MTVGSALALTRMSFEFIVISAFGFWFADFAENGVSGNRRKEQDMAQLQMIQKRNPQVEFPRASFQREPK